jgi:Bacterial Ig-like domain (group 3)/Divergent InlB B-repeat domain
MAQGRYCKYSPSPCLVSTSALVLPGNSGCTLAALESDFWRTSLNAIAMLPRKRQRNSVSATLNPSQWAIGVLVLLGSLFSPMASALVQPTVSLSSRENPIAAGKSNFLIARVQGGSGTSPLPRGTVTFTDSLTSTRLCVANLSAGSIGNNTSETACAFPSTASVGNHTIFIAYSGDSFYNAAGAPGLVQVVVPSYTATASAGAGGSVSPGSYTFVQRGESVFFDFTANAGFHLSGVTATPAGCGGVLSGTTGFIGTTRYTTDGMQFNCNFAATFSTTYAVTFTADVGGTVSPSGTQQKTFGSTATVTVTPNAGFRLTNVNGCGVVFVGGPAITTATAWTTAPISGDCTVSPASVSVAQGQTTQFSVSPSAGFQIASVTGCSGTRSGNVYTTGPITASCAVTATFLVAPLPTIAVTAVAGPGGSITPATTNVIQGGTASFTVSASSGFTIASVSGCGGALSGNTFNTAAISAACTVSATFSATTTAPSTARMIEYRHPTLDYYFITSRPAEIALLDATPPFVRTGQSFLVFTGNAVGAHPITRFYFDKVAVGGLRGSHFYTLVDAELLALVGLNPTNAPLPKLPVSEGVDSFAFLPLTEGIGGTCAAGLTPVFRLFRGNTRFPDNPNHRFTTSTAIFNDFVSQGWDGEGVKFCVPQ